MTEDSGQRAPRVSVLLVVIAIPAAVVMVTAIASMAAQRGWRFPSEQRAYIVAAACTLFSLCVFLWAHISGQRHWVIMVAAFSFVACAFSTLTALFWHDIRLP
jgi:hypothetical protein